MGVEVIKVKALRLSPEDRACLARELLISLDVMSEADIERLWIAEAIHRDDEIDKGASHAYPARCACPRTGLSEMSRIFSIHILYSLIYSLRPNEISLLAVAHPKRRPFYWRGRR